jgi:hypothetical protein
MEIISNEFVKYGLKPLYGSSYYWKFPVNKVITYNIIGMKLGLIQFTRFNNNCVRAP